MESHIPVIVTSLKETLDGMPWYGKSVYEILSEADARVTNIKPGQHPHAAIDLLYHMLTWSDFCLGRVRNEKITDMQQFERLDWREIDPQIHGWEEAVAAFKKSNTELIEALSNKTDDWLNEKVEYRDYDFKYLLHGIINHHIYHAAQIAYVIKAVS